MRVEDAPPAGWYPDPEGGSRLRWWEGTDWADRWRAPPMTKITAGLDSSAFDQASEHWEQGTSYVQQAGMTPAQSADVVSQVREAARAEIDRAASMLSREVRQATGNVGPLISQYTNKFMRWVRFIAIIGVLLGIAWVAWQIFAQVSLFDWLGDRIDNLTDRDESGAPLAALLTFT